MQSTATPTSRPTARLRRGRRRPALRRLSPRLTLLLGSILALGLVLALAGCGGGSTSPGVAHIGTASNASASGGSGAGGTPESPENSAAAQQQMVKYSQCMRTHGEPEFPEPTEGHIEIHGGPKSGLNPESPQFQAAEKACSKYAPKRQAPSPQQQAKLQEQALKMSQCMRSHGVPNFPDPTFSTHGGGTAVRLKAGKGTGIEPNSPQFQAAAKVCQGNSPLGKGLVRAPGGGAAPKGGGAQSSESVGIAP